MHSPRPFGSSALIVGLLAALCAGRGPTQQPASRVSYNRDVRPILAENCFACHGPDARARKAGLVLSSPDRATAPLESGAIAIVRGRPEASELIRRVLAADADERMPPAETGKHLTPAQIATLRTWIAEGAEGQTHWSQLEPRAVEPSLAAEDGWSRHPIDRFLFERLRREGLRPAVEADRVTLIRRLSFDLIGLPPSPAEVEAFVADTRADAYEALVDRLLASPHYGERMAVYWLDLVRYADTTGYHSDNPRTVTPYRDWVIAAFNDNLPFDRFTIEQLAGDLLPEATRSQRIASGYNRLNMTTEEGGAQPKEYENKYAADRVRNVSSVWMAATMGCCECHDHKFDPYSTRDFYAMAAFFADVQETAVGAREAGMPVPSAADAEVLARLDAEIAALRRELDIASPELAAAQSAWEQQVLAHRAPTLSAWSAIGPFTAASAHEAFETSHGPERDVDLSKTYQPAAPGSSPLKWVARPEWRDGAIHELSGGNAATYLHRTIEATAAGTLQLSLGSDDAIRVWVNGEQLLSHEVYRPAAPDQEQLTIALKPGSNSLLMKIVNGGGGYAFYFQVSGKPAPDEIVAAVRIPPASRSAEQAADVAAFHRSVAPSLAPLRNRLADATARKTALEARLPRTLVTVSGTPRTVRIRPRGNWQDDSGPVVEPAVPQFLRQPAVNGRATRLDLAHWLVDGRNPLTARVFVNRLWKLCFGLGISRTLDDLGVQGEWPVHPELLDWLALDFQDHGWDVKRAHKQLVMSAAYRQSSQAGALHDRDPDNRLIARQSRFRLDAEFVRDDALAISGLLVPTIGGSSVRPYQPPGYLVHLNFPSRDWRDEPGEDQYRRGLYTFWQRTFLHPSLLAFDASPREECSTERPRSNTPQQALTLLNDPTYVEAARVFAQRVLRDGGTSTGERLAYAYRRALSRLPTAAELRIHERLLADHLAGYRADLPAARRLLAVGHREVAADLDPAELAAWTSVARVILNLHETITRS
ncbi:MAG: DUF1553 domain-containing protein [Planctomycetes bacterium]|nr:DUF1553 domain-containing protein [Planctomycetota bacterium]